MTMSTLRSPKPGPSARAERARSRHTSRERIEGENKGADEENDGEETGSPTVVPPPRDPNTKPISYEIYSLLQEIRQELHHIRSDQSDHTTRLRIIEGDVRQLQTSVSTLSTTQPAAPTRSAPPFFGFGGSSSTPGPPLGLFNTSGPPATTSGGKKPKKEDSDDEDTGYSVKFTTPDAFEGKTKGKEVTQWITRMALVLATKKYSKMDAKEQMLFILGNTKGNTADLAQSRIEKVLLNNLTGDVANPEAHCDALCLAYADPDARRAVARKISSLSVTTTSEDVQEESRKNRDVPRGLDKAFWWLSRRLKV